MASNYYEKLIEELNRRNPGSFPEDTQLPNDVKSQFDVGLPDPQAGIDQFKMRDVEPDPALTDPALLPQVPSPEIPPVSDGETSPEGLPDLAFKAPPIEPSSFDVDVSTRTPRMEGREESLPENIPGTPAEEPKRLWELEEDEPVQEVTPTPISKEKSIDTGADKRATEDAAILDPGTGADQARRAKELAALEKRRKLKIIPELVAGAGDAISASASAFGGNAPGGSRERMIARHDKQLETGKADIDVRLRNDANSDTSKQYQNLLTQMMKKDPSDTAILGLTANQIAEKIPAIEKMMQRRSNEEIKNLALTAKQQGGDKLSPATKKFDEEMAKLTAEFTNSGGIKVAKAAVNQLQDSIDRFKKLDPGFLSRVGAVISPDGVRGLIQPEYKAIEQEVRQNVTELLRSTLGAQFTEREGERIFSQTFDPTLPMKVNLARTEALKTKLNTMAEERARAVDFFTQYGTFVGYAPQSDIKWTYDTSTTASPKKDAPRKTESGYSYSVD